MIAHLKNQGQGVRESGAFILGRQEGFTRVAVGFIPYERLQHDALHNDYVSLTGASFSKLWSVCSDHKLTVVADVHTHRFGPRQSQSDRRNPMIAVSGHMALIIPDYAQNEVRIADIGVHIYQGSHQWRSFFGSHAISLISLVGS